MKLKMKTKQHQTTRSDIGPRCYTGTRVFKNEILQAKQDFKKKQKQDNTKGKFYALKFYLFFIFKLHRMDNYCLSEKLPS